MTHLDKEKQKLIARIKRIRGQCEAVERSLGTGDDCANVLMLLANVRGGINTTKQALVFALELLRDQDAEIFRLNASLHAVVQVLGERFAEFPSLHARAQDVLEKRGTASGGSPTTRDLIALMLRIVQQSE